MRSSFVPVRTAKETGVQLTAGARAGFAKARLVRQGDILRPSGPGSVLAAVRAKGIKIPEMVVLSDKVSIMEGEVTVGLFRQVMEGYEITGHNAEELKAILADPSRGGEALTYVSLLDAREFASRLSDLTGRKFRVQTEEEWESARDSLSGDHWTWTETKNDQSTFVLRRLDYDNRRNFNPENRYSDHAVRLVEDL